jgi:hypothetical protein
MITPQVTCRNFNKDAVYQNDTKYHFDNKVRLYKIFNAI